MLFRCKIVAKTLHARDSIIIKDLWTNLRRFRKKNETETSERNHNSWKYWALYHLPHCCCVNTVHTVGRVTIDQHYYCVYQHMVGLPFLCLFFSL